MDEDELFWRVTKGSRKRPGLCLQLGVLYFHAYDQRRSPAGFPDLVLVGRRGILYRELKTEVGVLRPEQVEWRDALLQAGANWSIWRPSDFTIGRIDSELRALMNG